MAVYACIERMVMRRADAVITTGPGLAVQARVAAPGTAVHHIPDIPSTRIECTPEGRAAERQKWVPEPDAVLIAYVGSYAVYQGIDLLFAAIPEVCRREPRARFVIVGGSSAQVAARRRQMEAAGVSSVVHFSDHYAPSKLPDLLAAADILLSPRIAGINTPLKLLDYLKAGRAIVATETEANRHILDDRTALFAAPTVEAYAAGICRLAGDADLRERLSREGRRQIDDRYNFEAFRRSLGNVYFSLAVAAEPRRVDEQVASTLFGALPIYLPYL